MEIPGVYEILVNEDVPEEDRPTAALDIFHTKIGIKVLDDFAFTVHDRKGRPIPEKDGAESYTLSDRGEFNGRII